MAKIFDWDTRKGTLIDSVSKTAMVATNGTRFKHTDKGLSFKFDNTVRNYITMPQTFILSKNASSIVMWVKIPIQTSYIGLVNNNEGSYNWIYYAEGELKIEANQNGDWWADNINISSKLNQWISIVIIANNGTVQTYVDNILRNTTTPNTDIILKYIGALVWWDTFNNSVENIRTIFYNHALSDKERNKLYQEFLSSRPISPSKRNLITNKPKDLSYEYGLIAAYNMNSIGNILPYISGNGNNITISTGCNSVKNGIIKSNTDVMESNIYYSGNNLPFTFHFVLENFSNEGNTINKLVGNNPIGLNGSFYLLSTTNNMYYRAGSTETILLGSCDISNGKRCVITFSSNGTYIKYYLNGNLINTITPTIIEYMVYLSDSTYGFGKVTYNEMKFYNRELSEIDIIIYSNKWAKQIYQTEDFSNIPLSSILPKTWSYGTGEYIISEYSKRKGNLSSNEIIYVNPTYNWDSVSQQTDISQYFIAVNTTNRAVLYSLFNDKLVAGKTYRVTADLNIIINQNVLPFCRSNDTALSKYNISGYYQRWINYTGLTQLDYTFVHETGYHYIGFRVEAGAPNCTFECSNFKVEEVRPFLDFKDGTKYLECSVAGTIALPSKHAYGTWEWDWYRANSDNAVHIHYMATETVGYSETTTNQGYSVGFGQNRFFWYEIENGSPLNMVRSSVIFTTNKWYKFKMIRTNIGKHYFYILNENDNQFELINSDDLGTNPYTENTTKTTNFFVVNLDAGDRITNIKMTNGIVI